ncbi:MAG: hypothetical protein ACYTHN_14765 [Planctomycetota bacterium]|jgi:hypothetical protein
MKPYFLPGLLRGVMVPVLVLAASCARKESPFVQSLRGTWRTSGPTGVEERILIDAERIVFAHGSENEYSCAYTQAMYYEKEGTISIRIACKKWTGTDHPVLYVIQFQEGGDRFHMILEGRIIGIFDRVTG